MNWVGGGCAWSRKGLLPVVKAVWMYCFHHLLLYLSFSSRFIHILLNLPPVWYFFSWELVMPPWLSGIVSCYLSTGKSSDFFCMLFLFKKVGHTLYGLICLVSFHCETGLYLFAVLKTHSSRGARARMQHTGRGPLCSYYSFFFFGKSFHNLVK